MLLNFGEPARAALEEVVPFLERIFLANGGQHRRRRCERDVDSWRSAGRRS